MRRLVGLFLFISNLVFGQTDSPGTVWSIASEQGNIIRYWPNAEDRAGVLAQVDRFCILKAKVSMNELRYDTVGVVSFPRTVADFKKHLSPQDYQEWVSLHSSEAKLIQHLQGAMDWESAVLLTELKYEFLLAYGLGFMDTEVKKGEYYQYRVYAVDKKGNTQLWGTTSLFAKEGNFELERVSIKKDTVLATETRAQFRWNVEIPSFTSLDFPAMEDSLKKNLQKLKTFKNGKESNPVLTVFNRYGLHASNTAFLTYYRVNGESEWHFLEKNLATRDSTTQRLLVSSAVPTKRFDRVEAVLVPQDFAYNQGPRSESVLAWAVTNQSLEVLDAVEARDSMNTIVLSWKPVPAYYSGIEISKNAPLEEKKVIAVLPADATEYRDHEVFPAGTLFTYSVRPLLHGAPGLGQEIPAVVMHSCTTFSKPTIPYNLQVKEENEVLKLSWEAQQDPAFYAYQVLRGTTRSNLTPIGGNAFQKEYHDSTAQLSPQVTYVYAVMAMNIMQDTSAYSEPVSVQLLKRKALPRPPLLLAEAVNGTAYLSWDASNDPEIRSYVVQRDGGKGFVTLHSAVLETAFYWDEHPRPGSKYRVAFVSMAGDTSGYSPETVWEYRAAGIEGHKVEGIVLSDLERSVRVTWPAQLSGGVKGFKVYRRLPEVADFTLLKEVPAGTFSFEDRDVRKGRAYVYTVRAVHTDLRESPASEEQMLIKE